jgi:hypothetical protein
MSAPSPAVCAKTTCPPALLHLFALPQQHQADLPCPRNVCAAAGLPVKAFDLDGAQDPLALDRLAYSRLGKLLCRPEAHPHRPVFKDDPVGAPLGLFHQARVKPRCGEVNRRDLATQVERHGRKLEQLEKRRGEQVLAGVLLHVVEAALPVNGAADRACGDLLVGEVYECLVVALQHLHNGGAAKSAGIMRLAARCWIKRGAVEHHLPAGIFRSAAPLGARRFAGERLSLKLPQK